ncbi:universal stress protein [Desulfolithobacter sp.]
MEKKILVAIDGSVYSSSSLDYLIRQFANDRDICVHLLSIISSAGKDDNWMFEVDSLRQHSPSEHRRKLVAEKYLKDAKSRLVRNGMTESRISHEALITTSSVATAIHHYAVHGLYDSLLVGRRGMGMVSEMLMGSVSSYLAKKCHEVPLWIIDGEVTSRRFLLAVHCVPASLLAADHLAFFICSNPDTEVLLYHSNALFGTRAKSRQEDFHKQWGKEWCDKYLDLDDHLFQAHTQILIEGGVPKERITRLPTGTNLEASHDLLRKARKHRCGTIVLGRRGRDADKGVLGGVSDRTMQHAENMAVWLVG